MENKLYRDESRKVIGGVCAGLADYFGVDVVLMRLLFVFAVVVLGCGVLLYIILWIVIPKKGYTFNTMADYTMPPVPGQFTPVKKPATNAAIIAGIVLIIIGGCMLADRLDIIPDFDFGRLWPIVFIAIGLVIIFTPGKGGNGQQQFAPWDKQEPKAGENNDNPTTL
jgi:phage shock protein C